MQLVLMKMCKKVVREVLEQEKRQMNVVVSNLPEIDDSVYDPESH